MASTNGPLPGHGGYSRTRDAAGRFVGTMSKMEEPLPEKLDPVENQNIEDSPAGVPAYYRSPTDFMMAQRLRDTDALGVYGMEGSSTLGHDRHLVSPGFEKDLEPRDIAEMERRRVEALQKRYDQWLTRKIDLTKPINSRWVQRIDPEFFERRWQWLQNKLNMQTFAARMRLYGPTTLKDLMTLRMIENDVSQSNAAGFSGLSPYAQADHDWQHHASSAHHKSYTPGIFATKLGNKFTSAEMSSNPHQSNDDGAWP